MANKRWFLLNASDVTVATLDSSSRNEEMTSGALLSTTWNVAGTQALMKVNGADKSWRADKAWIDNAVAVYDNDSRYEIFPWFYTPDWQPPDPS